KLLIAIYSNVVNYKLLGEDSIINFRTAKVSYYGYINKEIKRLVKRPYLNCLFFSCKVVNRFSIHKKLNLVFCPVYTISMKAFFYILKFGFFSVYGLSVAVLRMQ